MSTKYAVGIGIVLSKKLWSWVPKIENTKVIDINNTVNHHQLIFLCADIDFQTVKYTDPTPLNTNIEKESL